MSTDFYAIYWKHFLNKEPYFLYFLDHQVYHQQANNLGDANAKSSAIIKGLNVAISSRVNV